MPALRRAARIGEGWHGARLSPDEVRCKVTILKELCEEIGRDVNDLIISHRGWFLITDGSGQKPLSYLPKTEGDRRTILTGTTKQVLDDIRRYQDVGVTHFVLDPIDIYDAADPAASVDEMKRQIELFAHEIRPKI